MHACRQRKCRLKTRHIWCSIGSIAPRVANIARPHPKTERARETKGQTQGEASLPPLFLLRHPPLSLPSPSLQAYESSRAPPPPRTHAVRHSCSQDVTPRRRAAEDESLKKSRYVCVGVFRQSLHTRRPEFAETLCSRLPSPVPFACSRAPFYSCRSLALLFAANTETDRHAGVQRDRDREDELLRREPRPLVFFLRQHWNW